MKAVSKVKTKEVSSMEFPCLMQSEETGIVVLFTSLNEGTVLIGNDGHNLGEYYNDWSSCLHKPWKRFDEQITLKNE